MGRVLKIILQMEDTALIEGIPKTGGWVRVRIKGEHFTPILGKAKKLRSEDLTLFPSRKGKEVAVVSLGYEV